MSLLVVVDAVRPALDAIARLGTTPAEAVQPESAHTLVRERIQAMQDQLNRAFQDDALVQDMAFAVAALADEVALSRPGPLRDHWMRQMLQTALFGETTAGEQFFVRLENLQRAGTGAEPALWVYYLCLQFGFQGKHRARGGDVQLSHIADDLEDRLLRSDEDTTVALAPNAGRPAERIPGRAVRLPMVGLSVLAVVGALVFYVVERLALSDEVAAFEKESQQAEERIKADRNQRRSADGPGPGAPGSEGAP